MQSIFMVKVRPTKKLLNEDRLSNSLSLKLERHSNTLVRLHSSEHSGLEIIYKQKNENISRYVKKNFVTLPTTIQIPSRFFRSVSV